MALQANASANARRSFGSILEMSAPGFTLVAILPRASRRVHDATPYFRGTGFAGTIRKKERAIAMLQGFRFVYATLVALALATAARAEDWQPVSPADLQMKSEPKAPKASAIYLYRQVDRDDADSSENIYSRIKILTDEGREYANVEIPYLRGSTSIRALQARVIHPDGSIVEFDGQVFDKPLVKARGVKMMAKSFTLPGVEV